MYNKVLEEKKRQLYYQKAKLYNKLMSKNAFYTLWDRFVDLFDWLNENTSLANIVSHLVLTDWGWTWEIPEFPEFEIKIPPLPPGAMGYRKAIYGVSQYDLSYYDPITWYEVLKKMALYVITQGYKYTTASIEEKPISEVSKIFETLIFNYFMRIQGIIDAVINNLICGFWILGYSKLSKPPKEYGRYKTTTIYTKPDLEILETPITNLAEIVHAPINHYWVCGFHRAIPNREKTFRPVYLPELPNWIRENVRKQMTRFAFNYTGFKLREFVDMFKSRKTNMYHEKFSLMYDLHTLIYSKIEKIVQDPIKINAYIKFAYEYIFGKVKKHRLSKTVFKYVDVKDWENYIILKWKNAGLDENILRQLIELLRPIAEMVWEKRLKEIW